MSRASSVAASNDITDEAGAGTARISGTQPWPRYRVYPATVCPSRAPGGGQTCHDMRVNETTDPALASSTTEAGPLILQAFAWDMVPDASHWRYLA